MKNKQRFLLEIGTEEIPARFFKTAIRSLRDITSDLFEKSNIVFSGVGCIAAPRRLAVIVDITDPVQKTTVSEVTGPPVKAAFDADGNPTKAAEGFALSQSLKVSDLKVKETGKGEYLVAVKETKGRTVSKVLPALVPEIIRSLHFPKSMRWGYHSLRFARPVRWLLCLYGQSVVRFEIDGIRSGAYTYGHRLLSPQKISVKDPKEYEKLLREKYVIVDHEKRRTLIANEIDKIARKSGGVDIKDEDLLNTVTFLVEYPYAVLCRFPREYLDLPPELLVTVMKDHQKYFAVTDGKGNMTDSFIVIGNTNSRNAKAVREGAEKVIKARFEDARFYYTDDTKKTLEQRADMLKDITFHDKLGTVRDKVGRIRSIAREIGDTIRPSLREKINTAASICKADLTTGVVREFPELQGITGYYYALHEGLSEDIALAVKEHYKPLNMSDTVPSSDVGRIVSIADKIDGVVAFFSAGIIPTGSEDPYALRRQAQGIVQILLSVPYPISLHGIIQTALTAMKPDNTEFVSQIETFFIQRVEFALTSSGRREDVVKSVLRQALDIPLYTLEKKAGAIEKFQGSSGYTDFILSVKRVKNILPPSMRGGVSKGLFTAEEEIALFDNLTETAVSVRDALEKDDFMSALQNISSLTVHINGFFDKVLVMDKDEKIKNNRLAFLKEIWDTAIKICDFSKLDEK